MLGLGWLALRQAQEALNQGRLEEAERLLLQSSAQGHRRVGELLKKLSRLFVERGERHLENEDPEKAWEDLLKAEDLQTVDRSPERLRQALTGLGIAQLRALLQAGNIKRASETVGQLRHYHVRHPELRLLEESTKTWMTAMAHADEGEPGRALQQVKQLQQMLLGGNPHLEQFRSRLEEMQSHLPDLLARLHQSADQGRWNDALEVAEQVIAMAPQHAEAKKIRSRAWKSVEPLTVVERPMASGSISSSEREPETFQRFCLWVDGIGGFLVCLGRNVTFGQAHPGSSVDVPLIADVSRLHAAVVRDGEGGYVLEGARAIQVNGKTVSRALLKEGDRITLGTTCQFQFSQPSRATSSARLEMASGHRVSLGTESVLLMGEALILGSGSDAHVQIPELNDNLMLFRGKEGLGIRFPGKLWINEDQVEGRCTFKGNASIVGDNYSFAIEPVHPGSR